MEESTAHNLMELLPVWLLPLSPTVYTVFRFEPVLYPGEATPLKFLMANGSDRVTPLPEAVSEPEAPHNSATPLFHFR